MTLYFFLNEKNLYRSRNNLQGNPRIIEFDPTTFWTKGLKAPSPSYATVEELVKKDKRFRDFKKGKPTTAAKLAKPANVIQIKDLVLTSDRDNSQAGRMLLHLIEGKRYPKQFSGIHHLPFPLPPHIVGFRIIEPPDKFGVYTAQFEIQEKNGKLLRKEKHSTLFPKHWSPQRLYDECLFALNRKIKLEGTISTYRSTTISGIPVEIHFDQEEKEIRTLYPLRTSQ